MRLNANPIACGTARHMDGTHEIGQEIIDQSMKSDREPYIITRPMFTLLMIVAGFYDRRVRVGSALAEEDSCLL